MRKSRLFMLITSVIPLFGVVFASVPATYARDVQVNEIVVATPVSPGILPLSVVGNVSSISPRWAAPKDCPPDPNAICSTVVTKSVVSGGFTAQGATFSQTQRCTRNMVNGLGQTVMQLWEDVNVTWTWSAFLGYYSHTTINWASRGTWVVDWRYTWNNLAGPNPSSGTSNAWQHIVSSGTSYYLGLSWNNASITQVLRNLATYADWGCS